MTDTPTKYPRPASVRFQGRGDDVRAFQVALMSLGYSLPRWGADGHYGEETLAAVREFIEDHGLDPTKGDAVYDRVMTLAAAYRQPLPVCFVDRRGMQRSRQYGVRRWSEITGITLHQTATCFLDDSDFHDMGKVSRAVERVAGLAIHHAILRNGFSVWSHHYEAEVAQAQRVYNASDVGIEIDGWFSGVEGDDRSFWRPEHSPDREPMVLTDKQARSCLDTIDFIVSEVARHGGEIKYIHAHRQTASSRRSDPGEQIWKRVALPAMAKHNLSDGGDGYYIPHRSERPKWDRNAWSDDAPGWPIPKQWDPRRTYDYYASGPDTPSAPDRG